MKKNYLDEHKKRALEVGPSVLKENGMYLQFFDQQTESMILTAVKQNHSSIVYAKFQPETAIWHCLKKDPTLIKEVKDQTDEFCMYCIKKDADTIEFINKKTEELCLLAALEFQKNWRKDYLKEYKIKDLKKFFGFHTQPTFYETLEHLQKRVKNKASVKKKIEEL